MKEHLRELIAPAAPLAARQLAREYVQARILSSLQRAGAMIPLAFHGGTALRFLYGLPRFSEDLDFALEGPAQTYDFRAWLRAVQSDLEHEGYAVATRISDRSTVHSGQVRLRGLFHDLGLPAHADETLMIKIEVDTRPPAGAGLAVTVVRRHVLLRLHHHDRASLLSGKLHAILQRPYTKGRDLYDLLWYLAALDWPPPNLPLLNNALAQTAWPGGELAADTWRAAVRARLAQLDWPAAVADVRPFLENDHEAALLTLEHFENLLRDAPGS